ncbi:MAG: hypothetical protein IJN04_02635 [Clostridia bacterium]|nr:hypothetical protein [Clostridia bacterium]
MSYDTHLKNEKKKQNALADTDIAQYEKGNAALKEQINATLDASAESQAGVYRQEIEQAPLDSRIQYDKNAMQEAVDRKKIAESLANMGMTDSGLSSSMQTALTVQKSRADNSVRVAEQQRIRAAESAIDQIFANNELQKAQKGIEIDQDTADYARTRRESANTLATQTATSLHNSEVEAATAQYEADVAAQQKWMQQQLSGQQDTAKLRSDYVKLLMTREDNPLDSTAAWQEAYRAYPDTPVMSQEQYGYYTQYLNRGYNSTAAVAAASAYASGADVNKAMEAAYEEELRGVGLAGLRTLKTNNSELSSVASLQNAHRSMVQIGLSKDTAAYSVGCRLYSTVSVANANQVGQLLEQCFDGAQLEAALLGAGLEAALLGAGLE